MNTTDATAAATTIAAAAIATYMDHETGCMVWVFQDDGSGSDENWMYGGTYYMTAEEVLAEEAKA